MWDDKHALGMLLFVMAVQQCDMLAAPRLSTSHALMLLLEVFTVMKEHQPSEKLDCF